MAILERIRSWAERQHFAANVAKISAGSVARTAILLLSLPIATRIYAPDAFGDLQLFSSIVSLFVAVGPLKYEAAIALPNDGRDSNHLAVLSILICTAISLLVFGIVVLVGTPVLGFLNAERLDELKLLLPVGIWLGVMFSITRYTLVAKKRFGTLATSAVAHVASTQSVAIGYGLFRPEFLGLLLGRLTGSFVGVVVSLRSAPVRPSATSPAALRRVAYEYRKFPLVNTIGVFANTAAVEAPVFLLATLFGPEVVGFYMMTNNLLGQPIQLVGEAVGRVFLSYGVGARSRSSRELQQLFRTTVRNLALIGLLPVAVVLPLAPWAVAIVLGDEWREVGVFMQILVLAKYLELVMTPVSTAFSIANRQEVGVALMIGSAIVRIGAMYYFSESIYSMLAALSISSAIFSALYLLATDVVLRLHAAEEEPRECSEPRD